MIPVGARERSLFFSVEKWDHTPLDGLHLERESCIDGLSIKRVQHWLTLLVVFTDQE